LFSVLCVICFCFVFEHEERTLTITPPMRIVSTRTGSTIPLRNEGEIGQLVQRHLAVDAYVWRIG
jgi:hypothetical protein